jgi:sec-independent protein translocase protein TatC
MNPPRLAMWLLERLGPTSGPLAGDLVEEHRRGRSAGWYWRQVVVAIYVAQFRHLRSLGILSLSMVVGFLITVAFIGPVFEFIMGPVKGVSAPGAAYVWVQPFDALVLYAQIAALGGFVLATPVLFYQTWFAVAGHDAHTRWFAIRFALLASTCFAGGVLLSHFVVFPWVWGFFLAFRDDPQVFPLIQSAFSFYAKLLLTCGVALQLPAAVLLLARVGAVTSSVLVRNSGYAAVVLVTVAAILTPTHDTVTLVVTALPLFLVYALCVLIAWGFARQSLEDPASPSRPQQGSAV